MTKQKWALVVGTEVATSEFESGAKLRLDSIIQMVNTAGFQVAVASRANAKLYLENKWDLVVLVSFSTSSLIRLARKRSKVLWFDPTDSWTLTRLSLLSSGDFKQAFILFRDLYFIWTSPKIDLISFINERDSNMERRWWSKRSVPLIVSIEGLDRRVNPSDVPRLVFSGDGSYRPNQKSVKFLLKVLEFLPPSMQIHLIGRGLDSPSKKFVVHGYLNDQEMFFDNDVHLAPIRYGAGIKLKVAVPLWNGLHVISTFEGSSGFKKSSKLRIAETPFQFAEEISNILGSEIHQVPSKPKDSIYLKNDNAKVSVWLANID